MDELQPVCAARLGKVKRNQDDDIMLSVKAKRSCQNEMKVFCDGIDHGDQKMYGCLKAYSTKGSFGDSCKTELGLVNIKPGLDWAAGIEGLGKAWDLTKKTGGGGIVITGALALAAIISLIGVVVVGLYCCWKRRAQSASNYKVVLPRGVRGGIEEDSHLL